MKSDIVNNIIDIYSTSVRLGFSRKIIVLLQWVETLDSGL